MASFDRVLAYRSRADEARRHAAQAEDALARERMLRLAASYERIAARKEDVERHAALIEVEGMLAPLTALLRA